MSCVRKSYKKIHKNNSYWSSPSGTSTRLPELNSQGSKRCEAECISDPSCLSWRYNERNGTCYVSDHDAVDKVIANEKWSSGRIECSSIGCDVMNIIVNTVIIVFVILFVWYLTKPCKK